MEKVEQLESMEDLNQALITKEPESFDELNEARKVLISVSFFSSDRCLFYASIVMLINLQMPTRMK